MHVLVEVSHRDPSCRVDAHSASVVQEIVASVPSRKVDRNEAVHKARSLVVGIFMVDCIVWNPFLRREAVASFPLFVKKTKRLFDQHYGFDEEIELKEKH